MHCVLFFPNHVPLEGMTHTTPKRHGSIDKPKWHKNRTGPSDTFSHPSTGIKIVRTGPDVRNPGNRHQTEGRFRESGLRHAGPIQTELESIPWRRCTTPDVTQASPDLHRSTRAPARLCLRNRSTAVSATAQVPSAHADVVHDETLPSKCSTK